MGFPKSIKDKILVLSARHCCVCHKSRGLNIEVHHIQPTQQGGKNTLNNAIALCFDCHADAGHYFAGHPKGTRLSPEELLKHKTEWFKIVRENNIQEPRTSILEVSINNKDFDGSFHPIFIKRITRYQDRDDRLSLFKLIGKDPMDYVREMQNNPIFNNSRFPNPMRHIKNYDDFIEYMNEDSRWPPEKQKDNCQPIVYKFGIFGKEYKEINRSNCELSLKVTNNSTEVLEDYKINLRFSNVSNVDSLNKTTSVLDTFQHSYNIHFKDSVGEFIPNRNILVQKDSVIIDTICFRPNPDRDKVLVQWELFARNIYQQGNLELQIDFIIEEDDRLLVVENAKSYEEKTEFIPKVETTYN